MKGLNSAVNRGSVSTFKAINPNTKFAYKLQFWHESGLTVEEVEVLAVRRLVAREERWVNWDLTLLLTERAEEVDNLLAW